MEKIIVELDVKSQKGVKEVEKLNKEISNTSKETADASKTLDGFTGGAVSKFKGLKGSIGSVVKGFKSLKFAILASGIGALLLAVVAVGKAFTSSEEGQNKFAKILGVIGSVTGNLVDLLSDLGEKIISVFENPKQAIIDLKDSIVKNITNRFDSLIETVGFLGSALKKVFSRDFSGAMDDAKKAGSSYVDTLTGVKNTIDKVTDGVKKMSAEITKDAKAAANIADQRAKADKLERSLIVERAEANRKRAELLDKAVQKEKFTAVERIKFLEDAGKIEDDITAKEIKAAQLRYESKVAENALSKSTKEDLLEEANLKANLINLETAKLTKQKLVSSQIVAAKREEAAELKAIEDKAIADRKEIQELELKTEEERRVLALQKEKEIAAELKALGLKEVADAKAFADAKIEIAKREQEAKSASLNGYASALGSISGIIGQETKKGKALAIASSLVNTYAAITGQLKAFSGVPVPGYAIAQAIATGVAGFANVKKIASVKVPNSSGGGSVPSGGSALATPSLPPAFNVVGASGTNQLASAIGSQSQEPVKAYVVSGDVTSAQSMDRNIVEGASI